MSKAAFRPMTDLEARAAIALGNARFAPATFDKRFAKSLIVDRRLISDKQAALMWALCWRYRRSIQDDEVSKVAKEIHEGAAAPMPQKELPW